MGSSTSRRQSRGSRSLGQRSAAWNTRTRASWPQDARAGRLRRAASDSLSRTSSLFLPVPLGLARADRDDRCWCASCHLLRAAVLADEAQRDRTVREDAPGPRHSRRRVPGPSDVLPSPRRERRRARAKRGGARGAADVVGFAPEPGRSRGVSRRVYIDGGRVRLTAPAPRHRPPGHAFPYRCPRSPGPLRVTPPRSPGAVSTAGGNSRGHAGRGDRDRRRGA